ncbi:unnamed protein product [Cladocopium goreaui]|uniref:Uncharacterized protein n=1 Tax=Cladocopium goreaui TaxID=2562237 RepID=A0A9P1CWE7_9DINO|nr:unnamed protein product [Cladocopium goreaui]
MAKSKGKVKAKAAAAVPVKNDQEDIAQGNEFHSGLLTRVHEAIKEISNHPVFDAIGTAKPLTIAQGGRQMPFDQKMALKALEQGNNSGYKCGGNLFWHNLVWLAEHRIPLNEGQIKQIQSFSLPPLDPPPNFPYVVTVAVDAVDDASLTPDGHWHRLSPAEPVFALLFSICEAVTKGDEAILKNWRRVLLTVDFEFFAIPDGEMRYWKAVNLREKAVELGQSVRLSLRQRIFDVAGFKKAKEDSSGTQLAAKKVASLYSQHVKLASGQEALSETFIDCACTIFKRIFSVPRCQKILEEADMIFLGTTNPWNKSIYSLQGLLDRAQSSDNIAYALEGMMDGYCMGYLTLNDFSPSRIRDYRSSYVEVLKLKKQVCKFLLGEFLTKLSLPSSWTKELREKMKDFKAFRSFYAPYQNAQADSAWLLGCPESVTAFCDCIDKLIYSDSFDGRFRDCVKTKSQVEDFMAYPSIAQEVKEVEKLARQEAEPEKQPSAASAAADNAEGFDDVDDDIQEEPAETAGPDSSSGMPEEEKQQWRQHMLKLLRTHVRFVPDKKTEQELATLQARCSSTSMQNALASLRQRPDLRTPPLREALYQRLVRCLLQARAAEEASPTLQSGDVALLLDAGKPGLKSKILNPWKEGTTKEGNKKGEDDDDEAEDEEDDDDGKPTLTVDTISLQYTEESLAQRKRRIKGSFTLKQLETAYILANHRLKLPCRDRKHYPGTSAGDVISGVALPALASEWAVEWKDKKEMLTKRHVIAVGGKTEEAKDEPKQVDRLKNKQEPFCFWGSPLELYEEYLHTFFAKMVLDLTPSDAKFAFACLRNRVGYVGLAFSQFHAEKMEERLLQLVEKEMLDSNSPLYSIAYSKALKGGAADSASPQNSNEDAGGCEDEDADEDQEEQEQEEEAIWDPLNDGEENIG